MSALRGWTVEPSREGKFGILKAMDEPFNWIPYKPPTPMSVLKLDATYYHSALQSFQKAVDAEPEIQEARREFETLLLDKYGGDPHQPEEPWECQQLSGNEPFQSFHGLVQFRNRLVHYKERREEWADPGIPSFLDDLGLTRHFAHRSLRSVVGMASELSKQLSQEVPYWLN